MNAIPNSPGLGVVIERLYDLKPLEVVLLDGLNGTPAAELAVRGWLEMHEKGLGDGTMNTYPTLKAFLAYAQNGQEMLPVGVMTWEYEPVLRRVWIFQSYVLPEFRGRGIYSAMWAKMVAHAAEELKASTIKSGTHLRNSAMRAVAARQGRIEESVTLSYSLD